MKFSKLPILCYVLCILSAGCARIADPKPPERHVPEATRDFEAHQIGEEIVLTFSLPERNTDGSLARTIRSLEIFRITEKAEAKIPAAIADLSDEIFLGRAAHAFSIPAVRFPEYMREGVFVIRDAPFVPPGESIYSLQFRYAAVFVNEKNQAARLSQQVFVQPMVLPPAPEGLSAVVSENEIRVAWTPTPENAVSNRTLRVGYNVYRSEKPDEFPVTPVNAAPLSAAEYLEHVFQFDKNYYYSVSVVIASNPPAESERSEILKVEARDIFPPLPPGNFTTVAENDKVTLFWTPSPSADTVGYRIFRINRTDSRARADSRRPLHEGLITGISHRDEGVEPGGDYIYEIQAVDGHGNVSETVTGNQ